MRIFFLINTLRSGGAQQALVSILENFKNNKYDISLIIIGKKYKINSKIYNKNIKIIYLNSEINNFFDVTLKLFKLVKKYKPNYFISTGNAQTVIYSRIVSFLNFTKHISWIQFDYENSIPSSLFKKAIWLFLFRYLHIIDYKIVLISNYLSERYNKNLKWDKKKFLIIPNTFSENYLKKFKKNKHKNKIILCPGRLDLDKNHLKIIESLRKFKTKVNNFKCLFIGEKGNAYKKILNAIKSKKLTKNIKIQNYIKSNNFLNILNNSYLVVLLSKKEPFGVIALETIYLKTNFLISKSSGFKDIIGNINARNVVKNFDDTNEIYEKILKLYFKPLSNNEKNIFYKKTISNFETRTVFKQWLKIFK